MDKRILIIDDEPDIRVLLKYNLEKEGYAVEEAENGFQGLELAEKIIPDLIILDVMMPDMDGIETCEKIRANSSLKNCVVCFLTARGEDYSQLAGFEAGADDYIMKPVKPKILLSKIAALLRRSSKIDVNQEDQLAEAGIVLDRERYLIQRDGERIVLPRKEFELMALLMSKPGKVFQRDEIMNRVWGAEVVVGDRTIDVHIRKLRKKIGENHIQTIKGVGYKFEL